MTLHDLSRRDPVQFLSEKHPSPQMATRTRLSETPWPQMADSRVKSSAARVDHSGGGTSSMATLYTESAEGYGRTTPHEGGGHRGS